MLCATNAEKGIKASNPYFLNFYNFDGIIYSGKEQI